MILRILNALPHLNEELVDVVLEQFSCFPVERIGGLILFDIDEDEAYVLDDCEDEMFGAVVPIFLYIFSKVESAVFWVDHGMVDFWDEGDLWGFSGELIECDFELESCVFVEAVADEEDSVPG